MKHIKQYSRAISILAILFLAQVLCSINVFAQNQNVGINYTGATPNASALLDIDNQSGPNFKGLLIPRVTYSQRTTSSSMTTLPAVAKGLIVYQTDANGLFPEGFYYNTSTTTVPTWVHLGPSQWLNGASNSIYYNAGSVGIGTTTTVLTFHVMARSIGDGIAIQASSTFNTPEVMFLSSTGTALGRLGSALGTGHLTGSALIGDLVLDNLHATGNTIFTTNNVERMRISNNGNVGIGTTTPSTLLEVQGTNALPFRIHNQTNGSEVAQRFRTLTSGGLNVHGDIVLTPGATADQGYIGFRMPYNATIPGLILNHQGNVGIGTTNPLNNLQIGTQTSVTTSTPATFSLGGTVSNTPGANLKLKLYDNGVAASDYGFGISAGSLDFRVSSGGSYNWYFGGGTSQMILNSVGNLGIGISPPTAVLNLKAATTGVPAIRLNAGPESSLSGSVNYLPYAWSLTLNSGSIRRVVTESVPTITSPFETTSPYLVIRGNDMAHQITFNPHLVSPGPNGVLLLSVTFGFAFTSEIFIVMTPCNQATAELSGGNNVWIAKQGSGSSWTGYKIYTSSSGLAGGIEYKWDVQVRQ